MTSFTPPTPTMTPTPPNRPGIFVVLPLWLLVGAAVLTGCRPSADDASAQFAERAGPDAVPVRTAPVVQEARALPIRTSGRLARKAEMSLSFKVGGFVETIRVDEGDRVRKGQVLARLDLDEINARVRRAEASLEKAERDLRRAKVLYADSVATLEEKQNAETAVEVAAARLRETRFNQRHATITAPSDGRIQNRRVEEHEQVRPGAPVFEFGADAEGWVMRVGLADKDVVKLRLGSPATVTFDAFPEEPFQARVTEIADAADPVSGTFEVELRIDDPAGRLKAGMIGSADLTPTEADSLFFVPTGAIVEGDGQYGVVYALRDAPAAARSDTATVHRVERREIRIARILGDEVAVRSGLAGTERVVVRGGAYLQDGAWARVPSTNSESPTISDRRRRPE
jgi:RND family efflux transporter MFP subunit